MQLYIYILLYYTIYKYINTEKAFGNFFTKTREKKIILEKIEFSDTITELA